MCIIIRNLSKGVLSGVTAITHSLAAFLDRFFNFKDMDIHDQEGVYILRCLDFYKIGKSKNIKKRLQILKIGNPFALELIFFIPSSDANNLEKFFHEIFEEKKVQGEWFMLNEEDVKSFSNMKNAIHCASPDMITRIEEEKNIYLKTVELSKEYNQIKRETELLEAKTKIACEYFELYFDWFALSDAGKKKMKTMIRTAGLDKVKEAIKTSYDFYYKGKESEQNWHKGFDRLSKLIKYGSSEYEQSKELKNYYYFTGILNNKFPDMHMKKRMAAAYKKYVDENGFDFEPLFNDAKSCESWGEINEIINQRINDYINEKV